MASNLEHVKSIELLADHLAVDVVIRIANKGKLTPAILRKLQVRILYLHSPSLSLPPPIPVSKCHMHGLAQMSAPSLCLDAPVPRRSRPRAMRFWTLSPRAWKTYTRRRYVMAPRHAPDVVSSEISNFLGRNPTDWPRILSCRWGGRLEIRGEWDGGGGELWVGERCDVY